jgi:hypothetical protein
MKPLETLFWLGTAGVLYMAANTIVKNVAKDVVKDVLLVVIVTNQSTNLCFHNASFSIDHCLSF